MSGVNNTQLDYESASLPPSGVNAAYETKDDKSLDVFGGHAETEVTAAADVDDDGETPTEEELQTLKKVAAPLKFSALAICFIELAERASYYGCSMVFNNFVRGPLPEGGNGAGAVAKGPAGEQQSAGALGMGSVSASAISSTFNFLSFATPLIGGIVADSYLGRFKTICIGTAIGFVSHVILVIPAIPSVIAGGHAFVGFIISLIILSFASGFIGASVAPLLCDQSPVKKPTIKVLKNGKRVIVDPQTTISRYLLIYYWCINIGAFFAIATTYSERLVGFWLAFLLPGIVYALCPIVLVMLYKRVYQAPPQGSVILEAYRVVALLFKRASFKQIIKGGDDFWNLAKPTYIREADGTIDETKVFWDDLFVDEIRQSIAACAVFCLLPIYGLSDGGIGNQLNDMSAAMKLNGIPNDIMLNFNALAIIVATPILTWGLYPFLDRIGCPLRPTTRLSIGFTLGLASTIAGALVQWKIYRTSPCGWYATTCENVSPVSIAMLIPMYVIPAVGELFVNVTSYELAYTRAPARMKGLVFAVNLFSGAISAAISLACSAAITDPYLIWPYVAVGACCLGCIVFFPTCMRHLDTPIASFADPERQAGKQQPKFVGGGEDPEKLDEEARY